MNQPGAPREDDRRMVSGIRHMLRTGRALARRACGLWSGHHGLQSFQQMVPARLLARHAGGPGRSGWIAGTAAVDSTSIKAHRCAHEGKGGERPGDRPLAGRRDDQGHILSDTLDRPPSYISTPGRIRRLLADKGYDDDWLRADLRKAGIVPVIPGTRSRKRLMRHDKKRPKDRWRAEGVFCRLKDLRRAALAAVGASLC